MKKTMYALALSAALAAGYAPAKENRDYPVENTPATVQHSEGRTHRSIDSVVGHEIPAEFRVAQDYPDRDFRLDVFNENYCEQKEKRKNISKCSSKVISTRGNFAKVRYTTTIINKYGEARYKWAEEFGLQYSKKRKVWYKAETIKSERKELLRKKVKKGLRKAKKDLGKIWKKIVD